MTAMLQQARDTLACPDCDLQQSIPPLLPGGSARCARCRVIIARNPVDPIDRPLALSLAAAAVFVIANTMPLMGLSAVGREASTTILGGAREMWTRGSEITAVIVAFCAVVAPGATIAFMLAVLLGAKRTPAPQWVGRLLRWAAHVQPWSMSEVMLLGILVALIKIAHLATVVPGIGLYAVGVLVVLLAVTTSIFEPRAIWNRVVWADGTLPPALRPRRAGRASPEPGVNWVSVHPGLASCAACGLLSRPVGPDQLGRVPPLRRHAGGAAPFLDPDHVGARDRLRGPVHSGQRLSRAHHDDVRHGGGVDDPRRGRLPLQGRVVGAGADRAGRERQSCNY